MTGMTLSSAAKARLLVAMILLYALLGVLFVSLANAGVVQKALPRAGEPDIEHAVEEFSAESEIVPRLDAAKSFFEGNMVRDDGHVELYWVAGGKASQFRDRGTNSEAISYYLFWNAVDKDKDAFDTALGFIENEMLHPFGYMMWRVEENGSIIEGGQNIASDADLRAIKALLIAEKQWGDAKYTRLINALAGGLEKVAMTEDDMLAPYGGASGSSAWTSDEVWLSYSDFKVFKELARRRGDPWTLVYSNMKNATLRSQIYNGLYNSQLTSQRKYGNGIDNGAYSINSLWIMVRAAESGDSELMESARKSLAFYRQKFAEDGELSTGYWSDGTPVKKDEAPWVYALVGRAAINLNDWGFSDKMKDKLLASQVADSRSVLNGAFPEGSSDDIRVGQFTMQESILTLQDLLKHKYDYELYLALRVVDESLGGVGK